MLAMLSPCCQTINCYQTGRMNDPPCRNHSTNIFHSSADAIWEKLLWMSRLISLLPYTSYDVRVTSQITEQIHSLGYFKYVVGQYAASLHVDWLFKKI